MKVKVLQKCFTGHNGNMFAGEEHEMPDRIAEKLIARGYVKAVAKRKKMLDLTNRKVAEEEIETPEGE